MDEETFYIVSAKRRNNNVTYRCPTPEWALKKAQDFTKAEYADLTITSPNGKSLTETDLVRLIDGQPELIARIVETLP